MSEEATPGRRYGCAYWGAVVLAVLGAFVVLVLAVVAQMMSDSCDLEQRGWFCDGGGQELVLWTGGLGGPGALVLGLVAATSRRLRPVWPWAVLAVQALAVVVMFLVAGTAP